MTGSNEAVACIVHTTYSPIHPNNPPMVHTRQQQYQQQQQHFRCGFDSTSPRLALSPAQLLLRVQWCSRLYGASSSSCACCAAVHSMIHCGARARAFLLCASPPPPSNPLSSSITFSSWLRRTDRSCSACVAWLLAVDRTLSTCGALRHVESTSVCAGAKVLSEPCFGNSTRRRLLPPFGTRGQVFRQQRHQQWTADVL